MSDTPIDWAEHRKGLDQGAVHVWTVPLDGETDPYIPLLSDAERQRAERVHFPHHRRRFAIAHAQLRLLLSGYRDCPPEALRFTHGPHGKPELADGGLAFNLSHSHDLAVVAVRRQGRIGVDIEQLRPMPDAEGLAERFFAPGERSRLRMVPAGSRLMAFFTCWVRKEAYIKATGEGLSFPLDRFEVSLAPEEPARLLHVADSVAAAEAWSMHALSPAEGYVAALVVEGVVAAEQVREWRAGGVSPPW